MKINIDYYTDFENETNLIQYDDFFKKYKEKIEKIAILAIKQKSIVNGNFYIGLGFVSENKIKQINKETRLINEITDVLSFPMYEEKELKNLMNLKENSNELSLGDIVICLDKVKKQAIEYNTGLEREVLYMITHGMCHIMGYDHESLDDKNTMRGVEEEILKKINMEGGK